MEKKYGELAPPSRILLGPGPSNVDPRVLRGMSMPLVGHLDPLLLRNHGRNYGAVEVRF